MMAVWDQEEAMLYVVFWDAEGGTLAVSAEDLGILSLSAFVPDASNETRSESEDAQRWRNKEFNISSDGNSVLIYAVNEHEIAVSDPSQTLDGLRLTLEVCSKDTKSSGRRSDADEEWSRTINVALPSGTGGNAGSSVMVDVR